MQPRVTVALATVWLTVAVLIGGAVTLRLSHDQYSPAPPRRHAGIRRDYARDWRDHDPAEDQPLDLWIGSRRSISAEEALSRNAKFTERDFSLESLLKDIVSSKRIYPFLDWQRRLPNIVGAEFASDKVDYGYKMPETLSRETVVSPSNLLDDPFVADDTFQDEGPGSMEIYKLDLSKEKTLLTATTPSTNLPSGNKSKAPKKTGHLNSKTKTTEIKSTTTNANISQRQSNFFEEQLTETPLVNRDAFGIGGVPELQVGCEGLEASSSSHKAKRSISTLDKERGEVPPSVLLDVTPVSLDLDDVLSYDEEEYEEMDELLKLKRLETTSKGNKPNRGDMDASHLNSDHLDEFRRLEKLPVRGDLGGSTRTNSSGAINDQKELSKRSLTDLEIKNYEETKPKRETVSLGDDDGASRSHGRRLLWFAEANTEGFADGKSERKRTKRSIDWGFGEDEGVVSSDELQTVTARRRQHEMRYHQDISSRRDQHRELNTDIDSIKQEYEKLLEQKRREEEEHIRRMQQANRRTPSRWEEEEKRRRNEMRSRQREEYRKRIDHASTPRIDDNEETRRRQMEERQRQEAARNEMARKNEEKLRRRELLAYLFFYYLINFTYRYVLNEHQRQIFEKIRYYFGNSSESIPMSFVLGFYVSLVVKRWWEQYKLLPWPDNLALFISAAIPGNDERGRLMRRNIVRYAVLAYVITLQRISLRVKRRFPTLQHMVDVGLMMESEKKIFEMMNKKAAMSKYWMPLVWATNIINRARKEALITSDQVVQVLLVELSDIRKRLGALIGYDTVCVPLVYTQVVTLSLYAYFFSALLGRQFVERSNGTGKYEDPDMYFPFFTALQFCFYIGWLKVAEVLINPFGEDDDDIELNWLIDRHIKAGYMIVDEMHEEHPELLKDQYWDEVVPKDLPYTVASEQYRKEEPKGSAEHYKVKDSDALYANVMLGTQIHSHGQHRKTHQDDMYADYESVDTPLVERKKNGWFQRQITRVGSVRSSSTTYSSGGGFFSRNRHNSVYSSPETGGLPQTNNPNLKMSLYDRLVGRKSVRSQRMGRQGTMTKLNSVPVSLKNRPRIPTPDVTKEVIDREQRLALSATNAANIGAGVVGVIPANGHYPTDLSVVVLSPIQETESTPASGKSGAAALAQAVLSPTLTSAGLMTPVTLTPVTMGHLTQLGLMTTATTTTPHINNQSNSVVQATLTEVTSEEENSGSGSSRSGSITGQEDRSTPLIDNNNSPMGSNGSSPIFDGYNDRSPILMRPEKLGYVVTAAVPGTQANRTVVTDARGRRSASLPGPPLPLTQAGRDDRSMSLPQSPGLQPREIRMISVPNRQDGFSVSSNQGIRSRTSSFGHDLSRSNQRVQDPSRKISSVSCTNASLSSSLGSTSPTSSTSVSTTTTVTGSKRGEVYV